MRGPILPALGELLIAKITLQVLEAFYVDLRRLRHLWHTAIHSLAKC